jgi:hypothetical protein
MGFHVLKDIVAPLLLPSFNIVGGEVGEHINVTAISAAQAFSIR